MRIVLYLFVLMFATIAPSLPPSSNNTDNEDKDNITDSEEKAHEPKKQIKRRYLPTSREQAIFDVHWPQWRAKDSDGGKNEEIQATLEALLSQESDNPWDHELVRKKFGRMNTQLKKKKQRDRKRVRRKSNYTKKQSKEKPEQERQEMPKEDQPMAQRQIVQPQSPSVLPEPGQTFIIVVHDDNSKIIIPLGKAVNANSTSSTPTIITKPLLPSIYDLPGMTGTNFDL